MNRPEMPEPGLEGMWRAILLGTDPRYRRTRRILKHVPSAPRCKMCAAPFAGPGRVPMGWMGRDPWAKNPKYCSFCYRVLSERHGGAEIECSFLFADVRGSTPLAETMSPRDLRALMDRFYDLAARILVDYDALVDKFVGDEVIGIFIPALTGDAHAARAIGAAREILAGTGHGRDTERRDREPWLPVGIGVNTGTAFVGAVGEGPHAELTALGDPVNIAARLSSVAGAGEILVTVAAADAAGTSEAAERRELALKGKSELTEVLVLHTEAGASRR
jgi:adenylate cyclase